MKTIIWVIIGAVVIFGGYSLINSDRNDDLKENQVMETGGSDNEESAMVREGKKMAFSQFLKEGGSYKCTVNQSIGGIQTNGTTYINDGMIRGEYSTEMQDVNIDSTMIVRDGFTYTWSSAMPLFGFKAKVIENAPIDTSASFSAKYSFNAEQIGDYDCQPWTVDASKFVIPSSVTFKEVIES